MVDLLKKERAQAAGNFHIYLLMVAKDGYIRACVEKSLAAGWCFLTNPSP